MKKLLSLVLVVMMCLSLVVMASCGKNEPFDATEMIASFKNIPTKGSVTFKQTYTLDVGNDQYQSFAKDIADEVKVEYDLTAGSVYYYGICTGKDGSKVEQLVTKDNDGVYYYMTTSTAKTSLATEADAIAKISTLMATLSRETAGYIDAGAFLYTGNAWMKDYIMLGSTNVPVDSERYFTYTYSKTDDNGLKAEITTDYIGYYGDSGVFEFGKQADKDHASTITLVTDEHGCITSFEQNFTSYQELNIINPPVPLKLDGSRSFTAEYDKDIASKKTMIDQNDIVVNEVENATVKTYDFDYATFSFTEGTDITAGHYVAVQVNTKAGYKVASVKVNGVDATLTNGYYVYMTPAVDGVIYSVVVTIEEDTGADMTPGTIVVGTVENATIDTFDFDYGTMAFVPGTQVAVDHFVAFQVKAAEGYEVATATVNGADATFINGYYCFMSAVKAGETYTIEVTMKASTPVDTTVGTIVVNPVANATVETFDFDLSTMGFVPGTEVAPGHYVAVRVNAAEGYKVTSVKVNGVETTDMNGNYCHMAGVKAGEVYTVDVTVEAENPVNGTIVVTNVPGLIIETYDFNYGTFAFVPGTEVAPGHFVAVKVTSDVAYTHLVEVASVKVNGVDATNMNGYYCHMTPVAAGETYTVEIIVK